MIQNIWETIQTWVVANGLTVLATIVGVYLVHKFNGVVIEKIVRRAVISNENTTRESELKRENTLIKIIHGTVSVLLVVIAGLMLLSSFGINIGPLLAAAGVAGLAFGFGGQYLIRDVISGLFIIMENQYRVGDVVCFDDACGVVEDITLRMTTLRDLSGVVHHIPHGEVKKVSNLTKGYSRVHMDIGVDYGSDLNKVINVINQVGQELSQDPAWSEHILKPPQFLRVDDFGDSAIILKILGDTQPIKQWDVMGELRLRLKAAFDKEGIVIPFPQRVIHKGK